MWREIVKCPTCGAIKEVLEEPDFEPTLEEEEVSGEVVRCPLCETDQHVLSHAGGMMFFGCGHSTQEQGKV